MRIPATRSPENSARIELRSPDPSANPYLAFTGILAAGLDGISSRTEPPLPVGDDVYEMSQEEKRHRGIRALPTSLRDAVDAFERSGVIRGAIGPAAEYLIRAKRAEIEEFDRTVTNWERLQYLDG